MTGKKNIIAQISKEEAYIVLKRLANEDDDIKNRIEKITLDYLTGGDVNETAEQVFFELESIRVEELWNRSGKKRYGYVEPSEEAWKMFRKKTRAIYSADEKVSRLIDA
ncbi:hypothetical protein AKJ50_02200 [candidate division MSBL1 archaeon SCGC-AAA382A13]|uniref:Uncharacterized protein n=1 Tax=candidate division MSBL1 archaeon SCGC-AAA382A13 TaxID=1698279 RepID=A0A133VDV4_9EURY|nr:hypothetical protein AKJ50_02200 [candidate division MSBL1 archaeon SCGC-AAA382A13]